MTKQDWTKQLNRLVGKRVCISSRYIPDKPRNWRGILEADKYGSYWIENDYGEVHFSAGDVAYIGEAAIHLSD